MSKYNSGASIPISSLSDEELKIAIHEWAEGNDSLESLLWKCYKNGIETQGCHSGLNSYLQIGLKSPKDKLVVWTTTPWTLPGNSGVCVGEDFDYTKVKVGDNNYIVVGHRNLDVTVGSTVQQMRFVVECSTYVG